MFLQFMHAWMHACCKNKLVVLTTDWLPWLQTNAQKGNYIPEA